MLVSREHLISESNWRGLPLTCTAPGVLPSVSMDSGRAAAAAVGGGGGGVSSVNLLETFTRREEGVGRVWSQLTHHILTTLINRRGWSLLYPWYSGRGRETHNDVPTVSTMNHAHLLTSKTLTLHPLPPLDELSEWSFHSYRGS